MATDHIWPLLVELCKQGGLTRSFWSTANSAARMAPTGVHTLVAVAREVPVDRSILDRFDSHKGSDVDTLLVAHDPAISSDDIHVRREESVIVHIAISWLLLGIMSVATSNC